MNLSVLSLNMWLLPAPFSTDNKQRLDTFIEYAKKTKPDIIALQEIWPMHFVNRIRKQLPMYNVSIAKGGLFNATGLMTLSKLKPKHKSHLIFKRTPRHNLQEFLASKGILTTEFATKAGNISFSNVQIYSATVLHENKVSEDQFKILKDMTKQGNHIVAGDLNFNQDKFIRLNAGHFYHKKTNGITICGKNKYQNTKANMIYRNNKLLDYVLTRIPDKKVSVKCTIVKKPIMSDHYGVLANIRVQ
ncbi:MAG: endonuclease/exonuclease/phosphatase family protein [Nanoarchaeota archaeon]|nr:endonuclease/exonuclease/phosphatase family protein [Nanoarchaeota archaeon]